MKAGVVETYATTIATTLMAVSSLNKQDWATGADAACIKCHADKQGPSIYEHAPVKTDWWVASNILCKRSSVV
jgi:hypothetical protein